MIKTTSQTIKLGIFVVIGTILLIVGLYFIGQQKFIFSKNFVLYAVFENVNGLQLGNNVRYSGVNVGTITKINMIEVGKITVQMSVQEKIALFIKKDAIASISSDGLVGSMVLNIIPGKDLQAKAVISGDAIQSQIKTGMDEMLNTLNTTNENAALLSSDLLKITHQILEGKGTVGRLINDTIMAQNIKQTVIELRTTSEKTSLAISKINQIISKINYDESAAAVVLSDTLAANKLRNIFSNFEKSSEDINKVTKNLNDYINEIKTAKGAINHITQDRGLVREIDKTMIDVKAAAHTLNQTMDALKQSFLFRGYFKNLEKKENKTK